MPPTRAKTIHCDGTRLKDSAGRTVILRGVNLAGSSKIPYTPNGATHRREHFFQHRDVSFVGRPFPLEEADEHFERLRSWGFTFLRFLVTWEAIEHAGPGQYDQEYLDYLEAIVDKAAEYEMTLVIDPHQDVWSRFTGGDGAPGWTLEAAGFEMRNFHETGAALVHQLHVQRGEHYPMMRWASNYGKLATATMFTLFFAGNDFAPQVKVDGQPIQDYLQEHFFAAMQEVAKRLVGRPHVVGYDSFNEPSAGFIGKRNLRRVEGLLRIGDTPTPYQAMLLGDGIPQRVTEWQLGLFGLLPVARRTIDPRGKRAWVDGQECIWQQNGVWAQDAANLPRLLKPDYFSEVNGRKVDFAQDYLRPFINRYAKAIREIDPDAIIFLEFDAFGTPHVADWGEKDAQNIVFAPHWYDFFLLMTKRYLSWFGIDNFRFRPVLGRENVQRNFAAQLSAYKAMAQREFGSVPTIIGEIGIPYDLRGGRAYVDGNFRAHTMGIDDYLYALENNLLSATIWNYTPDNTNAHGDQWNGEDLSIYSPDQRDNPDDLNSGGRALEALVRPYAMAVAGVPLRMDFFMETGVFEFSFQHDATIQEPTVLFIPNYQYPQGYRVTISDGDYEIDRDAQRLFYYPGEREMPHFIRVEPAVARPLLEEPRGWRWALLLLALLLGVLWLRRWRAGTRRNRSG